jgi:hypothetical protein
MNLYQKISTAISRIKPVLAIAAFSCIAPGPSQASTAVSATYVSGSSFAVSFSYFHDNLSAYGTWVDYEPYGWCWTPASVHPGWRPYTHGYWAYTDYGWSWVSSEPFGWATYHYGRWVPDPYYGWVWVPGTVWAPAWVAWHQGPGYVGWAPLPPAAHWDVSIGFSFHDYDHYVPASSWCFVEDHHFVHHNVNSYVLSPVKNKRLLGQTHNVTSYRNHGGWPVNDGLDVRAIEKSGAKVKHLNVVDASSPFRGGERIRGNSVEYYRPRIQEKNVRGLKPADRFVADRSGDRAVKSKLADRGGREIAFQDERAALQKSREDRRVQKVIERGVERGNVERVNRRQDVERVNQRQPAERVKERQSVERVNKRQDVQRKNERQVVERTNKRQATERVQARKPATEKRQFADARPSRRSLNDATQRRVESRKAERVERSSGESRKAQSVEERSKDSRSESVSRSDERVQQSKGKKASSSKGSRGGKRRA